MANRHIIRELLRSAAKKIDELRTIIAEKDAHQETWDKMQQIVGNLVGIAARSLDAERATHETTKRTLENALVALNECRLRNDALLFSSHSPEKLAKENAQLLHSLDIVTDDKDDCDHECAQLRARLESAEDALRRMLQHASKETADTIGIAHFARFKPRGGNG